jgi:hypothetical protein
LGEISLRGASIRMDDSKFKRVFGWIIVVAEPKQREMLLFAKHEQDRREWIDALQNVINSHQRHREHGASILNRNEDAHPKSSESDDPFQEADKLIDEFEVVSFEELEQLEREVENLRGERAWKKMLWIAPRPGFDNEENGETSRSVEDTEEEKSMKSLWMSAERPRRPISDIEVRVSPLSLLDAEFLVYLFMY